MGSYGVVILYIELANFIKKARTFCKVHSGDIIVEFCT